jgi:hypothetical protein
MLTKTTFLTAALLLAFSASGAVAQYASPGPTYGVASGPMPFSGKPYYAVPRHQAATPRQIGRPTYANEVPFAPF